ncbi:hypothetical protein [Clostridium sp. Marseille-Q2269]|uniref:hypothetical protein n=1 Tax=Clostridium sp. Marseille-Q2269 TaxID=2942205 RepID=UPI002073E620|nr:hypothetical protein [Clostridium sp. Marseille-Q2269]
MVAFLLIVIGLILIFINVKAIKKEDGSFSSTLKGSMENIDEYKEEIGLIRKEFAETLIDIQKEMEYLKKELNILKHSYENKIEVQNFQVGEHNKNYLKESDKNLVQSKYIDNKDTNKISQEISYKHNPEDNNGVKINEVSKLIKEGRTIEEICEILNIGKGEVILIKELYSK